MTREEIEENILRAEMCSEVTVPGGKWREVLQLALLGINEISFGTEPDLNRGRNVVAVGAFGVTTSPEPEESSMTAPQDAQATAFEKESERLAEARTDKIHGYPPGVVESNKSDEWAAEVRAFIAGRASLRQELAEKDARIAELEKQIEVFHGNATSAIET